MSTANRYGYLAVCLALVLATLCGPPLAVNAAAQDKPVQPPRRVAPLQRHGRHEGFEGFEQFNAFAERLRTRAKEEEEDLAELVELVRAWRMMKEVGLSEEEALKMELEFGWPIFATEDAKEGPKAFAEKRTPNFQRR